MRDDKKVGTELDKKDLERVNGGTEVPEGDDGGNGYKPCGICGRSHFIFRCPDMD